jgi:hypothetical protein
MAGVCVCGLFHESCAKGVRIAAIAKASREDDRTIESRRLVEAAWDAMRAGRDLPLKERDELEKAWRRAIDVDREVSSAVWAENRAAYDAETQHY